MKPDRKYFEFDRWDDRFTNRVASDLAESVYLDPVEYPTFLCFLAQTMKARQDLYDEGSPVRESVSYREIFELWLGHRTFEAELDHALGREKRNLAREGRR